MLGIVLLAFHDISVTFILTTIQKYPEATTWYKPFMMVMLKVALQKNADLTSVRKNKLLWGLWYKSELSPHSLLHPSRHLVQPGKPYEI